MTDSEDVGGEYRIQLTPLALEMLAYVKARRQKQAKSDRIDKLKSEPENKANL